MATRVDIKRDGNGNPALAESLAGSTKDRLQVGREILNPLFKKDGQVLLNQLGYYPEEIAYLAGMFPLLTYKAQSEKDGKALSFREPIDTTSSRRSILLETPRAGVITATFNSASDRYAAVHEEEEAATKSLKGVLRDNSGNLAIGRLLVVSQGLIDDDNEMRRVLREEVPAKRVIDGKTHFASLIRAVHLAATDIYTRDQTGLTSGMELNVNFSGGVTSKHIWRNIASTDRGVVLGRVVRTKPE